MYFPPKKKVLYSSVFYAFSLIKRVTYSFERKRTCQMKKRNKIPNPIFVVLLLRWNIFHFSHFLFYFIHIIIIIKGELCVCVFELGAHHLHKKKETKNTCLSLPNLLSSFSLNLNLPELNSRFHLPNTIC